MKNANISQSKVFIQSPVKLSPYEQNCYFPKEFILSYKRSKSKWDFFLTLNHNLFSITSTIALDFALWKNKNKSNAIPFS